MSRQSDPEKLRMWRERLARFASSGLSLGQFCARKSVSTPSFYHWRKKLGLKDRHRSGTKDHPRLRADPAAERGRFRQIAVAAATSPVLPTAPAICIQYQIKYVDPDWCITPPTVLKASSLIGTTVNPCGPSTIPPADAQFPGQIGPYNQPPTVVCTTTPRAVVINDGSPDSGAVRAFHTLMGQSPPVGPSLFWESIGSQIKYRPDGSTNPEIIVQPYPTYYVYRKESRQDNLNDC